MKIFLAFLLLTFLFFFKIFSVQASATSNPVAVEEDPYYSFGIISNELGGGDLVSQFMLPYIMEQELENADKGEPKSQYIVAVMYGKGVGLGKNLEISKKWHSKALKQGFIYDPFDLNTITKRLKRPTKLEATKSQIAIKGFKIGQKKVDVSGRWAELSIEPLVCESIGANKDGYPWEKCIFGVKDRKLDLFPEDGGEPIVPLIKTPEDKSLTIGLIPLQRAEFTFRGETLVKATFKLVNSKTLYNPNWNMPALKFVYDSCPRVDLCAQYEKQFSKVTDIKVKADDKYEPSLDYEKCGTRHITWITKQETMTCWGKDRDWAGRDDLFLYSEPKFKEPGTMTVKELNELVERQEREKEQQKINDL